jgi:hypothetical protein
MKKDEKMEMTKAEKTMRPLKYISCDPEFRIPINPATHDGVFLFSVSSNLPKV